MGGSLPLAAGPCARDTRSPGWPFNGNLFSAVWHSIWASVLSLIARQIGHACNGLMAAVLVLLLMPCRRSALLKPTSNYLLRFVLLVQLLESAELFFLETQHNKDLDYPSRRQVSPPLLPSASTFPQRATHFYDLRGQLGAIQRLRDTDYRASYYFTR